VNPLPMMLDLEMDRANKAGADDPEAGVMTVSPP
jgi:hypothetical protein